MGDSAPKPFCQARGQYGNMYKNIRKGKTQQKHYNQARKKNKLEVRKKKRSMRLKKIRPES